MNSHPKIIIPGFFIRTGKVGGAENAVINLAHGLVKAGARVDLFFFDSGQVSEELKSLIACEPNLHAHFTGREYSRFIAEQMFLFRSELQADAIIFPNYHTPVVIPKSLGKVATIIHDCQYLHFPQYSAMKRRLWLRFAHRVTLARANKVITLSESAKDDIMTCYNVRNSEKVHVIGNPVSWERFKEIDNWSPPFEKYILSVAHDYPHKNIHTLINAFSIISKDRPDVGLILVGQVGEKLVGDTLGSQDNRKLIHELGLQDKVHITGFIKDDILGALYKNALLFIFPSLFEGFGFPPIEAMGLGVPTLTTKCASLPEVTQRLACYVDDPYNVEEWAKAATAILNHADGNKVLSSVQQHIRKTYDLKNIGQQYLECIFN